MGLLTLIFGLPLAPVRGVIAVGQALQEQAEHEMNDRSRIRRELEEAEAAFESGEMDADRADEARRDILRPLVDATAPPVGPGRNQSPERG